MMMQSTHPALDLSALTKADFLTDSAHRKPVSAATALLNPCSWTSYCIKQASVSHSTMESDFTSHGQPDCDCSSHVESLVKTIKTHWHQIQVYQGFVLLRGFIYLVCLCAYKDYAGRSHDEGISYTRISSATQYDRVPGPKYADDGSSRGWSVE
jgi:hypothetical protein